MQSTGTVYAHGTPDWGPVYVDVDLGQQYVRLYDSNGDLALITECVTGNLAEGQETITGVFALEGKESPAKLIGLDNDMDGEPDYETDVDFWMPFYGGYGLHDALWRASFGGDEFQYNGSHGCVNLPYNSAAIIYETIDVGDPVVVHW
jgi:lipoprotein-anchoring transpeptidase ErfK/SrfK